MLERQNNFCDSCTQGLLLSRRFTAKFSWKRLIGFSSSITTSMLPQLKDGRKLWFDGISSRSLYLCALCNLIELRKQPAIVSLRNVYPPSFIFGCASRYRRTSSFPTVANDEINCAEVHETHADIQPVKVSDVTRNHRSILNSHAGQSGRQLFTSRPSASRGKRSWNHKISPCMGRRL